MLPSYMKPYLVCHLYFSRDTIGASSFVVLQYYFLRDVVKSQCDLKITYSRKLR